MGSNHGNGKFFHLITIGYSAHFRRRLMVITGAITFIVAICYFLFFPDSPTTAWFLTPEEKIVAIQRIKSNRSGTENKHFKMEQYVWEDIVYLSSHSNRQSL